MKTLLRNTRHVGIRTAGPAARVGQPVRLRRGGYTLLEVILAASLSVALLSALYSAIFIHLKFAREGPESNRRSQFARAVLNRIAADLRGMVISPDLETVDSTATTSTSSSSSTTSEDTVDVYAIQAGMIGGPEFLQFYTYAPPPNLDDAEYAALGGLVSVVSNLRRVTYTLEQLPVDASDTTRSTRMALVRSDVAAAFAATYDGQFDETRQRASSEYMKGAEVGHLEFWYWDDVLLDWVDSWGVDTPIAPPKAIKVILSLQSYDDYLAMQAGLSGGQSTWDPVYEMVVPIIVHHDDSAAAGAGTASGSGATGSSGTGGSGSGGSGTSGSGV